ncbi:MAG: FMN-binding protein [Desulfobacteraceae bacterium]|nr:MAG: FMN-binding protein [Desulfobacteraceae bacterium]
MSERIRSVLFAVVMCLIISLLLTAASTGLQRYQQINMRLDKQKNILESVGLIEEGKDYPAEAIQRQYREHILEVWADPAGRIIEKPVAGEADLPIYLYTADNSILSYIVPINSRGLWGPIMGYLAIKNDGATIAGFTVFKHSETPGLGGEIESEWFQENFVGKKIVNRKGEFVSIRIAKGKTPANIPGELKLHYVDGISGATLTGNYLTSGIEQVLENYEPVSVRFRKHRIRNLPVDSVGG